MKLIFLNLMREVNENQALNYYFDIVLISLEFFFLYRPSGLQLRASMNFLLYSEAFFVLRFSLARLDNLRIFNESLNVNIKLHAIFSPCKR